MDLFGYQINRKKQQKEQEKIVSFVPPSNDDGSLTVAAGGAYGTYVDLDGSVRTEAELVTKYRAMAMDPIIDLAVQDICNEAIVEDGDLETVSLILDTLKTSESIKNSIRKEFTTILQKLEFDYLSYEIFRRWYIDGRLYYHVIIDEKSPSKGIVELRYVDPRYIKKVREVKKEKNAQDITIEKVVAEYYIYNQAGFQNKSGSTGFGASGAQSAGIKISKDSIAYCTSGIQATDNNLILSYMHKAIRPLNQLRSMEDSLVIYRISRAPERRIFYVDVGGLPKAKAEQYLNGIMTKFKNKVVYDSSTGEVRDDRKFMTMLEDFWLPRREGGRGTEITTLPGGQNLGEIEDVEYFQSLLYKSLNVPVTRLQSESTFSLGRATEISRDEVKFSKFIIRLRNKFSELFNKLLEQQLILKGICTPEDWKEWRHLIHYDFAIDNYFHELKTMEIMRDRIALLRDMEESIGTYYSHEYTRRNILLQTEEELKIIDEQIKAEKNDPRYADADMDFDDDDGDDEPESQAKPPVEKKPEKVEQDKEEEEEDEKD
tara:strand:- start:3019 stop:4650 length:1632 start_codon:yes stop_codon:yes gene_type:complete